MDKLAEKAIAAGVDQETTNGREFLDLLKSLDLGVMLDFNLSVRDCLGREVVYSCAAELDKMIPFGRGGTNGWIMTTGVTASDHGACRAELTVKRWR